MRLLNVRLTPEDEKLVDALKARGVSISDVVRRALREEGARVVDAERDPVAILEEIIRANPGPPPTPRVDTTDRRAVQEHIGTLLRAQHAKIQRGRRPR